MTARALRLGTRGSALALWQANHVAALISKQPGAPRVELVQIRTEGDVRTDVPLWAVGGRAFFTKEIDRALLASEVDIAVHSLKDLSTVLEDGITLAAALTREDPRDALVSRDGLLLSELPAGARVGTSSLRRRAFLALARPDVQQLELRGNVPTRIERLRKGNYDAIILAAAGLRRLGLEANVSEHLSTEVFPPAVSQGVIGVCARASDAEALRWLKALDDPEARFASTAERALLRRLEGGCQVPLGALARLSGTSLRLHAAVCALDGSRMLAAQGEALATLENAAGLGQQLADELLSRGAGELIAHERSSRREVEAP
ncbi:MAG TPA: hydroxymethylbilane synthase [Steroidobacteraceae bacterium]|nr:hydroxymethylbilane synthase [Steroidobacteraceae bacterium]